MSPTREAAMVGFGNSWRRKQAHGKGDDEAQRTGPNDSVLRRDRDRSRVGRNPNAGDAVHGPSGFIEHDRATGAYRLADSGRATLAMILDHAGIKVPPK
jgi:hypothetical protein